MVCSCVAVSAMPVIVPSMGPTNLVAVIIPLVFMLIDVVKPEAVVAVPVRFPVKLEAVIIPEVFILAVVVKPEAVVAVPVRFPVKLEAVIIPEVFILDVGVRFVAVVAVPWKVGAVTVLLKLPVPTTSKFAPGAAVPIPRYFATGLKTSKSGVADMLEIVPDEFLVTKRYW